MRALILAAGRGERMRPLTDTVPKPLLEVGGRRLIDYHLAAISGAGIVQVLVNLSWLGGTIRDALGRGCRFGVNLRYSDEGPTALETAGGIVAALPALGPGPFLVVNADVWSDIDYAGLPTPGKDDLACVVLVANPAHNSAGDFSVRGDRVGNDGERRYTFAGVGLYRAALFAGCEPGRRPLAPLLRQAADAGRLRGVIHQGSWADAGTPGRLASLRRALTTTIPQ